MLVKGATDVHPTGIILQSVAKRWHTIAGAS